MLSMTLFLSLILCLVPMTPCETILLAESQLIGGHAEYYALFGLGVPSLRSLWGAVRNRQLYILRMYCKNCISFNFSIFSYNLHDLPQKKIHALTAKKNKFNFFFRIHTTYRKKKLHAFTAKKKLHD